MESFDPNFRLSILNSLLENGRIEKESLERFLAKKAGKTLGPAQAEEDEEAAVKAAIDILSRYPVSADDWASIESIWVDGGDEIYFVIEPFLEISTGGESDYYLYESIAEAAKCSNLKVLAVGIYTHEDRPIALDPIASLAGLEKVVLDGWSFTGASILSKLPSLKELSIDAEVDVDDTFLDALRARGVEIK